VQGDGYMRFFAVAALVMAVLALAVAIALFARGGSADRLIPAGLYAALGIGLAALGIRAVRRIR
jgi:hypothetical protein